MDQPKPAVQQIEEMLGIDLEVRPVPRMLNLRKGKASQGNRKNLVDVIEPTGKVFKVTRHLGKHNPCGNFYKYWCDCTPSPLVRDRCEHIKKAIDYWCEKTRG